MRTSGDRAALYGAPSRVHRTKSVTRKLTQVTVGACSEVSNIHEHTFGQSLERIVRQSTTLTDVAQEIMRTYHCSLHTLGRRMFPIVFVQSFARGS